MRLSFGSSYERTIAFDALAGVRFELRRLILEVGEVIRRGA